MAPVTKTSLLAIVLSLYVYNIPSYNAQDDSNAGSVICNGNSYDANDPYGDAIQKALSLMAFYTPKYFNGDYYMHYVECVAQDGNSAAFASGLCYKTVTSEECGSCIDSAVKSLESECFRCMGGQMGFKECSVRYENHPFTFRPSAP